MVVFLIICAIAGVVLGLRFNVLILIPAILLVSAITIANGIVSGHASSVILFVMFGTLGSLQAGYFVGCVLQAHLPVRAARDDIDPKLEA